MRTPNLHRANKIAHQECGRRGGDSGDSAGREKLVQRKNKRTHLTPTGILMEGVSTTLHRPLPRRGISECHSDVKTIEKELDSRIVSRVHTGVVSANSLRSGELARLTGVSADTLRHYERLGILPTSQRTDGGYRVFPASSVERVQLAQRALQLGFSLAELSTILRTRDNGGVPCHQVLTLTEEKLHLLGQQIAELKQTQNYMRKLVRHWRKKLKHTPPSGKAMLLHSLVDKPEIRSRSNNLKRRSRS
jgi:DNA-binding transcriptional MerR regulator